MTSKKHEAVKPLEVGERVSVLRACRLPRVEEVRGTGVIMQISPSPHGTIYRIVEVKGVILSPR